MRRLFIAVLLLLWPSVAAAQTFMFYAWLKPIGDNVISWPGNVNGGSNSVVGIPGPGTAPPACFYITRAVGWRSDSTGQGPGPSPGYIIIGKIGQGIDGYLTPRPAFGAEVADTGWYPADQRPLFMPGDEIHVHAAGSGLAYATIYFLPAKCPP